MDQGTRPLRQPPNRMLPTKVSRPSSEGLVERTRLFDRLDQARRGVLVWVFAPGGAGKTALAASWIAARGFNHLWYQIDAGDNDPSTLFHYLGLAAPAVTRASPDAPAPVLPHLTPEYTLGLPVYVRRFFEALTADIALPAIVVFDNYHELSDDAPLHALIAGAIESLPAGVTALFLSRRPPPAEFARHLATATFTSFDWDDLKLDASEVRAIAAIHGLANADVLDRIEPLARGWAAGVTLLARASMGGATVPARPMPDGTVFDYFGVEVFQSFSADQQRMLATTALAPRVSARLATALCGDAAPAFLAQLHARRLFVDRRDDGTSVAVYEFHPLFREFLLKRGEVLLDDAERRATEQRSARLLESEGAIDEAFGLWADSQSWDEIVRMVGKHAGALMAQGRGRTLEAWIERLPADRIAVDGWMLYWRGVARSGHASAMGITDIERAYDLFAMHDDSLGALLACAQRVAAFAYRRDDNNDATQWLDRCDALYVDWHERLPHWAELALLQCLAINPHVMADHPLWIHIHERTRELERSSTNPRTLLAAATYGLTFHVIRSDLHAAERNLACLTSFAADAAAPPMLRLSGALNANVLAWQQARHAEAHRHLDSAFAISDSTGVRVFQAFLHMQRAYTALSEGDQDRAAAALDEWRPQIQRAWGIEAAHFDSLEAPVLFFRGDRPAAIELMRSAVERFAELNEQFGVGTCGVQLAQMLMLVGEHAEARARLDRALTIARAMHGDLLAFHALLALAWSWLATGDQQQGLGFLRQGLAIGARWNYMNCHPLWIPQVMSRLLGAALEADIEVDYVRRFIVHRGVAPDELDVPGWPWPIRVYSLGYLRVRIGEQPLQHGRKVQRRALELLKAIIAGGSEEVARQRLIDALWPDAEGGAAENAFEVALHRLRKLLGRDDAILLEHGKIRVNSAVVWIDALAFERLAKRIEFGATNLGGDRNAAIARVFSIYGAPFLSSDDEPWLLPYRERLSGQFRRVVLRMIATADYACEQAIVDLQHALDIEPTAESLVQALVARLARASRHAEAREVQRRYERAAARV